MSIFRRRLAAKSEAPVPTKNYPLTIASVTAAVRAIMPVEALAIMQSLSLDTGHTVLLSYIEAIALGIASDTDPTFLYEQGLANPKLDEVDREILVMATLEMEAKDLLNRGLT